MDREAKHENSPLLPNNNHHHNNKEDSPRKPFGSGGGGGGGGGGNNDRLKRDEWSEGAVSSLLEAYEGKWILRNRAKLKGQDWEDVAMFVSARANSTKSPKTQTQCKNKIESMKKRYRSESAAADTSSWPLFPRLDHLLRGSAPPQPVLLPQPPQAPPQPSLVNSPLTILEPSPSVPSQPQPQLARPLQPVSLPPPPAPQVQLGRAQNSHGSDGVDRMAKEDGTDAKLSDHESDKHQMETDSSTPALYSDKEKTKSKNAKSNAEKKKRKRREDLDIADSVRWLAEVVVRSEQARVDAMRDLERMRAEAEVKRSEMDLKRTEIIANTQLEIAKLFAGIGKGVDSSLRIGRS